MFGLSGFLSSSKAQYGAVFDVSSDSVGIALIQIGDDSALPHVIFSHRVRMRIGSSTPEPAERIKQMRETLFSASLIFSKDALQALAQHDKKGRVSKIFLVASAPWAYTISREVSYDGETDFEITQELINDLATSAEKELAEPSNDEAVFFENGFVVVERTTVDVRVNGYSIKNPIGLKGKTISLSHITGFMQRSIVESLVEVRDKILTDTEIDAHSGMLVTYCVLRDFFPETNNLVVVSVTGESTEIGIIQDGVLLETHSIHFGAHTLVRDIIKQTEQTPEHVLSMLRGYAELTLSETARNSVETQANPYRMRLMELISTIVNRRALPKTVIVLSEPGVESYIRSEVLTNLDSVTSEHHTILHLETELLETFNDKSDEDIRLAIAARFFHKIHCASESVTT